MQGRGDVGSCVEKTGIMASALPEAAISATTIAQQWASLELGGGAAQCWMNGSSALVEFIILQEISQINI